MPEKPAQSAEGAALQRAMVRERLSARQAANQAGISEGRWRQIVAGYQSAGGQHIPVTAPPATLARMAAAVGVTADDLTEAGRSDAAEILRDLTQRRPQPVNPGDDITAAAERDEAVRRVMLNPDLSDDDKRRIAALLIEDERRAAQHRVERAEELIRLVRGED
jgi:transcriptional regulator with XRE-family HTH domain